MRKILVVHHEIGARTHFGIGINRAGMEMVEAESVDQARDYVKNDPSFGVIVCLLQLPDVEGTQFLQELKANQATAKIPFIMLTYVDGKEEKTLKLGASEVLRLPIFVNRLVDAIQDALAK